MKNSLVCLIVFSTALGALSQAYDLPHGGGEFIWKPSDQISDGVDLVI